VPDHARQTAQAWWQAGVPAQVVTVLRTQGSAPREAGTRMVVSAQAVAGTIGGGHLELQAIARARQRLTEGNHAALHEQHFPLGPALGQCCGGAVTLGTQALSADVLAQWPPEPALFTLQLYGAGHVGRAIAHLLATLPCAVQWIDERDTEFPAEPGPPHIQRLCVEPVQAEVATAPPGSFYLVLTHRHDLDMAICETILARGDFAYLGLIGSATKRARFMHRFEQRGVPAHLLDRIVCPIGVPGITGKEPEQLAIAVVAQLLQVASSRLVSSFG